MKLKSVDWEITQKCNMRCKHCIGSYLIPDKNELVFEDKLKLIDSFCDQGCEQINFTGGEPFCAENFYKIVNYCTKKNISKSVITNGSYLSQTDDQFLNQFSTIGLSIDSDYIRGKGALNTSLIIVENLINRSLPIAVYTTICNETLSELHLLIASLHDSGVRNIKINDIVYRGRAQGEHAKFTAVSLDDILRELKGYVDINNIVKIEGCTVDGESCYCSSSGEMYYCTELYQSDKQNTIEKQKRLQFGGNCCYDEYIVGGEISICLRNRNLCCLI